MPLASPLAMGEPPHTEPPTPGFTLSSPSPAPGLAPSAAIGATEASASLDDVSLLSASAPDTASSPRTPKSPRWRRRSPVSHDEGDESSSSLAGRLSRRSLAALNQLFKGSPRRASKDETTAPTTTAATTEAHDNAPSSGGSGAATATATAAPPTSTSVPSEEPVPPSKSRLGFMRRRRPSAAVATRGAKVLGNEAQVPQMPHVPPSTYVAPQLPEPSLPRSASSGSMTPRSTTSREAPSLPRTEPSPYYTAPSQGSRIPRASSMVRLLQRRTAEKDEVPKAEPRLLTSTSMHSLARRTESPVKRSTSQVRRKARPDEAPSGRGTASPTKARAWRKSSTEASEALQRERQMKRVEATDTSTVARGPSASTRQARPRPSTSGARATPTSGLVPSSVTTGLRRVDMTRRDSASKERRESAMPPRRDSLLRDVVRRESLRRDPSKGQGEMDSASTDDVKGTSPYAEQSQTDELAGTPPTSSSIPALSPSSTVSATPSVSTSTVTTPTASAPLMPSTQPSLVTAAPRTTTATTAPATTAPATASSVVPRASMPAPMSVPPGGSAWPPPAAATTAPQARAMVDSQIPVPVDARRPPSATPSRRTATRTPTLIDDTQAADDEMERHIQRVYRRQMAQGARQEDIDKQMAFPQPGAASKRLSPRQAEVIYGNHLCPYEVKEMFEYDSIYYVGSFARHKHYAVPEKPDRNFGYDDERGDYVVNVRDHLAYRYEIIKLLGRGSFGQVLQCRDHKTGQYVAIKLIRNKRRFHHQAVVEVKIMEHLTRSDTEQQQSVVHMTDSFTFRQHLCVTMELLSINLYELIKANNFDGFSTLLIRRFTQQVLACLTLMRQARIVHCDLKPENILLVHPRKSEIRVIDFGSSCFENEKVYTYIQSRFYRSPEVILGMDYNMAIDMWSLGCILAELHTGYPIFPGENEQDQLACIMEVLGLPDRHLLEKSTRRKLFFDSTGAPRPVVTSRGHKRRPNSKTLASAVKSHDELFLDFIARCLTWDPERRMKADAALRHPWFWQQQQQPPPPPPAPSMTTPSRRTSGEGGGGTSVRVPGTARRSMRADGSLLPRATPGGSHTSTRRAM